MVAAVVAGSTTAANPTGNITPSTGYAINVPTDKAIGDVMAVPVYFAQLNGGAAALNTPAGWILECGPGASTYRTMGWYIYKITDATALANLGSSVTFTAQTTSGTRFVGQMLRITGVDLNGTISVSGQGGTTAAGTSFTFPSLSAGDIKLYALGTNTSATAPGWTFSSVGGGSVVLTNRAPSAASGSVSDSQLTTFVGGTGATSSGSVANSVMWGIGFTALAGVTPVVTSFEAQPSGTDILTTNAGSESAPSTVVGNTGSTRKYSNLHPASGSMGFENFMPNGTASYVRYPFTPSGANVRIALRFYVYYPSSNPLYSQNLVLVRNSSGVLIGVNMTAAKKFQLINAAGAGFVLGTADMPLDTLIRVEVAFTVGSTTSNGVVDSWAWYLGHSTTPVEASSGSITNANLGTTIPTLVQLGYGSQSPADTKVYYDDVKVAEKPSGFWGPTVVFTSLKGILRQADGTNKTGTLFYFDGTNKHPVGIKKSLFRQRTLAQVNVPGTPTARWFAMHRGGSYNYPEETLFGYQGVMEAGATILEVSLQRSSQGTWWCFHDATVDRTVVGQTGNVNSFTDAQLATFSNKGSTAGGNASQPARPIAKFSDVLAAFPNTPMFVEDKTQANTPALLDILDANGGPSRFVLKMDALLSGTSQAVTAPQARGYMTWAYIFDAGMGSLSAAIAKGFTMIGMDYNSSDSTLSSGIASCIAGGVVPTGHIVPTQAQRDRLLGLGMRGLMLSNKLILPSQIPLIN